MSDRKLSEAARTRPASLGLVRSSSDGLRFECQHCGRTWEVVGSHCGTIRFSGHGRPAGFVRSAANNHGGTCGAATAEERRAIARIDEKRWRRNPPLHRVSNNHAHPGYGGVPVWPKIESK